MGILTWIIDRLSNGQPIETSVDPSEFFNLAAELYIRDMAFQSAVNLIANSVSKCEFKTYLNSKEVKLQEYYLFNIEPNRNQNSSEFLQKMVHKLYENNEALIIEVSGQMLVADSFSKETYALYDYQFKNVTVDGFNFNRTFMMEDVLYLKLNNKDIRRLINGMYETYGKMVAYAQDKFQKSKGNKGTLEISGVAQGKANFQETFQKMMNERFTTFFKADNAVLPLFDGYKYNELDQRVSEGSRDIKAMVDDIYDFTARAFCIPQVLLRGEVANNQDVVNSFLTFCIDPLCDKIQEEINRKRSGYKGFVKGTFVKIDTKAIKHIDLLSVATSIDKLISSGAFCINDIRNLVGDEPIAEDWAYKHFITKNYSTVEEFLKEAGGGTNE
ncbi:phage portal protein [Anaerotalea alkaliphila]|uniref:Phage portal protein n=1 Tax=Anaerotalea alkaliphila TaxID=2662126 RepID=A0A7X5HXM7_9FIRM|nr:phage portal protein [Anaerotalea alkaliphila]